MRLHFEDEERHRQERTYPPVDATDWKAVEDWVKTERADDHLCGPKTRDIPPHHTDPSHYTDNRRYETWDVITDWGLDFLLGNIVKYASRAGRKGGDNSMLTDLIKCRNYVERAIEREEEHDPRKQD